MKTADNKYFKRVDGWCEIGRKVFKSYHFWAENPKSLFRFSRVFRMTALKLRLWFQERQFYCNLSGTASENNTRLKVCETGAFIFKW